MGGRKRELLAVLVVGAVGRDVHACACWMDAGQRTLTGRLWNIDRTTLAHNSTAQCPLHSSTPDESCTLYPCACTGYPSACALLELWFAVCLYCNVHAHDCYCHALPACTVAVMCISLQIAGWTGNSREEPLPSNKLHESSPRPPCACTRLRACRPRRACIIVPCVVCVPVLWQTKT